MLLAKLSSRLISTKQREKKRLKFEKKRRAANRVHEVEYFHQLDDPYSHLTAQILAKFASRYDIKITSHLIRATGGKLQPEQEKLAVWARRDAELIAPYFGLSFPDNADVTPSSADQLAAASMLAGLDAEKFIDELAKTSRDLWDGTITAVDPPDESSINNLLDKGAARLEEMGHYSGATFYYGGEWYWGVDRLFHLEKRLQDLGACKNISTSAAEQCYIAPRPDIDLRGIDASNLDLHFYPSLNSPYTAIVYDRTLALADSCNINFYHKPVLPMVMRGLPLTPTKTKYLLFDTKREADFFGIPFGNLVFANGVPTRDVYSLLPWAIEKGKDSELMQTLIRYSWAEGKGLHKHANIKSAVDAVGLDWAEAEKYLGGDDWQVLVGHNQEEMIDSMGLWGVPCFRVSGPDGYADFSVWGQDRLWLVADEIRRRANV